MPKTDAEYWVRDLSGQYGTTTSPEEWTPRGWVVVRKQPRSTDLVWLQHNVTGGKQVFAYGSVEQWGALGWELSEPPTPKDLTKDSSLVDVDEEDEALAEESVLVEATATPKKAATASKSKE